MRERIRSWWNGWGGLLVGAPVLLLLSLVVLVLAIEGIGWTGTQLGVDWAKVFDTTEYCKDQYNFESAQENLKEAKEFDEVKSVRSLDSDGDGVACENQGLPHRPTPVYAGEGDGEDESYDPYYDDCVVYEPRGGC